MDADCIRPAVRNGKEGRNSTALLALTITWILCLILTSVGAFPDDPAQYGYFARTDIYNDAIRNAVWFRIPYPGQFGVPSISVAGFIGMTAGALASIVESVGDYHACALITGEPPPPVHAINRGVMMEGLGCIAAGLWGAPSGYTSYSTNISIISLTKIGSRVTSYIAAGLFCFCGVIFKFSALCSSIPAPVYGGIFASTIGMVASIGFANLSFVKVDTSRNLFIIGIGIFMGVGVPDYLDKHPDCIQTGSVVVDQILNVVLGSNMFIGGVTTCILDNLVRGSPEEKGTNWRQQMADICFDEDKYIEESTCYVLPFGMDWIRRTYWTKYFPFSPTFTGIRLRHRRLQSEMKDVIAMRL
ncbi:Solute carrier family 23 member 1 [Apostichopus japonicus]|uniref:Solute carrier family 23 member 1 n=1 Tax=Stichopus japonicus TaxID=307972 RepID=A0A2G8KVK5_STIJA|nr:Solute carrier family 23 member 1 [Apostichopus japonicus]